MTVSENGTAITGRSSSSVTSKVQANQSRVCPADQGRLMRRFFFHLRHAPGPDGLARDPEGDSPIAAQSASRPMLKPSPDSRTK
jgi:hypothetical protein